MRSLSSTKLSPMRGMASAGGKVAVPDGADNAVAGARREQQFRHMRGQADDAPRRLLEHDGLAAIIGETDFRCSGAAHPGLSSAQSARATNTTSH